MNYTMKNMGVRINKVYICTINPKSYYKLNTIYYGGYQI